MMLRRLLFCLVLCPLGVAVFVPAASARVASAGLPAASSSNPLAGMPWGVATAAYDEVLPAYDAAPGRTRELLGRIALRPRVRPFGQWYPDPRGIAAGYINDVTAGNPNVLAQMSVFALVPWEGEACRRLPTPQEQDAYKAWVEGFARGIGTARALIILQPDLPIALCVPHHSQVPLHLVAYAARVFSALPHTTVYLDAGASDWPTVSQAVAMLTAAGVRRTRGFALNDSHYASTEDQISFGEKILRALGRHGVRNMHFVINTAANGRPFTYQQYHGPDYDNAPVCRSRSSHRCVTLGIPPTTDVTSRRWGLSARARRVAGRLVDAYLWVGRPWLFEQNDPFELQRALALVRTTPF